MKSGVDQVPLLRQRRELVSQVRQALKLLAEHAAIDGRVKLEGLLQRPQRSEKSCISIRGTACRPVGWFARRTGWCR